MKAQHLMSETEYTERDMEVTDLKGVEYGLGDLPEGGELGHVLEKFGVPEHRNGSKGSNVVNHDDLTVVVGNEADCLKAPTRSVSRMTKKAPGCIMVCPCTGGVWTSKAPANAGRRSTPSGGPGMEQSTTYRFDSDMGISWNPVISVGKRNDWIRRLYDLSSCYS